MRRSDGTSSTYYATSDHLGSADLVLDAAGNVLARESFTAFGARRGSNWQGVPSTADYTTFSSTTRQGFTGQEMLDSVGLAHMNGRVYDPTLGRFLSADTVIQTLGSSQAINPYAYAWNDPLKYIDPSGHSLLGDIVGIIVAIVIVIVAPYVAGAAYGVGGASFAATAAVAGFVGGFVGAYISTGSLSAALTAGLIAGITAFAFAKIGSYAAQMAQRGSEWAKPFSVLAHAAVGCANGVASGGNCGRGALAAGISEAAVQWVFIKPEAVGFWGKFKGAAEAGLVGGVAARITGGKFDDGFTVAAAGYLFNSAAHQSDGPTAYHAGDGTDETPTAFVGGAKDYPNGAAYAAYLAYIADNPDATAAYFQWNQGAALAQWIDAQNGTAVVYAHSWGGDTAASVVAAGHSVAALVTVDPVSWSRPSFRAVAANAGAWWDFNATGGSPFEFVNMVAGFGGAWNAAPSAYSTYMAIPLNHVGVMCAVAPSGC